MDNKVYSILFYAQGLFMVEICYGIEGKRADSQPYDWWLPHPTTLAPQESLVHKRLLGLLQES